MPPAPQSATAPCAPTRKRRAPLAVGSASASPAMRNSPASARAFPSRRACDQHRDGNRDRRHRFHRAGTAAFGVAAHGQGLESTLAQIVADTLAPASMIFALCKATAPPCRAVPAPMPAAAWCWQAARKRLHPGGQGEGAQRRPRFFEALVADLVAEDGRVTGVGTDRSISFREVARAVIPSWRGCRRRGARRACRDPNLRSGVRYHQRGDPCATVNPPETYEVRVERSSLPKIAGGLVNPLIVDGQVHGEVAQGIGEALYEEVIHDERGQVTTGSLVDYLVPSACARRCWWSISESEFANELGGFRGMGEGGTIGARRRSTRSPMRSLRSGSKSTNFRQRLSGCSP